MFRPSWWPRPCPCPWRSGATGSSAPAPSTRWPCRPPPSSPTGTTPSPSGVRSSSSAPAVRNTGHGWHHTSQQWPTEPKRTEREETMEQRTRRSEYSREANLNWVQAKMDGEMERWRDGGGGGGGAEEREGLKEGGEPCCISSAAGATEFTIAGWRLSVGEEERWWRGDWRAE